MSLLLALAPSVALVVYGQLMLKWRIAQLIDVNAVQNSPYDRIIVYLQDPLILSGYCAAFLGSLAWMLVIDRYPLNQAYPIYIGLTLCLTVVSSSLLLGETITFTRVLAVSLIIAGVALSTQT